MGLMLASSAIAQRVVLAPDRVLDGRGGEVVGARVVVEGGRITGVTTAGESAPEGTLYDLSGLTLMPGLIDTHVHIAWHFDADGRTHSGASEDTETEQMLFAVENAYRTLLGGVTTAQSLGAEVDLVEREGEWTLLADLPGVDNDGITILTEKGQLVLRAERAALPTPPDGGRWLVRERPPGRYEAVFELGDGIDPKGIGAKLKNGVLVVHLPKSERIQPRKVEVRTG